MRVSEISFKGMPPNYCSIDKFVSRSAQPLQNDFLWLKKHGVTDVINFRTMISPEIDFNEEQIVHNLGMNYYNIKSWTRKPSKENILKFLEIVDKVKQNKGKVHIHCKAGADRTGMYAFIYETLTGLGSIAENEEEWIAFGHHKNIYPDLIDDTKEILKGLQEKFMAK